ncbi:MAG: hypothetical protein RLZZ67_597 [Candidatus Parcubacteria bacterium]|jgi:hypothetical protein
MDVTPASAPSDNELPICVKCQQRLYTIVDGNPVITGYYKTPAGPVCITCHGGK